MSSTQTVVGQRLGMGIPQAEGLVRGFEWRIRALLRRRVNPGLLTVASGEAQCSSGLEGNRG